MIQFGTGGWRAVIGDGFTKQNIQTLASAICGKMKAEGVEGQGILMGYDRRFLSKEAMQWAACVFAAQGVNAFLINKSCPTPLAMYYVEKHGFPYGMMITASHNPAIYNGVKVFTAGGRDADESQTQDIERYIAGTKESVQEMDYRQAKAQGLIREIYPLNEYLDDLMKAVDMDIIRRSGLRIVLDPMYGVSETSLRTLLQTARCELEVIHDRHDTLFGGKLPAPSAATLRMLQTCVADGDYDLGIATDGDADRLGIIDDTGRFLHPNEILVLLYHYLKKYKHWQGPAVRNICTTHVLDRVAESFGEVCYEVPVGFKHVSAKMNETDAIIGGESSGGLTVRGHIKGKDGIYAAMLLVEMIAASGKKLSQLTEEIEAEYGQIDTEERDYRFSPEKKEEILSLLMEQRKLPELPFEIEKVSYLDGSKVYFANGGWVIARFSGTEPLLRIFSEMPDPKDAGKVCGIYEQFLGLPGGR